MAQKIKPIRPEPAGADHFGRFAACASSWLGSKLAFLCAGLLIVVWAITGPVFHYSDTWQLVINTGTTIVTFLMVFLIQQAQNKDALAIQLKLNELVAALEGASNRLVNVEDLSEHDLRVLREFYARLAERAKQTTDLTESHSIDEAERRHHRKLEWLGSRRGGEARS